MATPNSDEKVLSYGDVVLRRSDLDILSGPHFINDRIIEFYFTFLTSGADLPADDVLLVSPSIAHWIKECNGSIKDFVEPLNFPQKKLILFPINDNTDVTMAEGGNHWTLLAFVKSANVFVHHDSSSGKINTIQARRLYLPVLNYTSHTADFIDCPITPKQVNGYDCGLYVIAFARAICSWFKRSSGRDMKNLWFDELDHITPSAVSKMRSEILDLIDCLMEKQKPDPLEEIIADGRMGIRPSPDYEIPMVVNVNLDELAANITHNLTTIVQTNLRIQKYYEGTTEEVDAQLAQDVIAMVDFAIGQTYNKLRNVLALPPNQREARMRSPCPIPAEQEFPTWISSTLSSIGPCRWNDGPLIVYASSAAHMNNYGRIEKVEFRLSSYDRLLSAMRKSGLKLSPFNHSSSSSEGSYFPTVTPKVKDNRWTFYGQVNPSHYVNEDVARIAFVSSANGNSPFENIGLTRIGFVDDQAVVNAVAAAPPPAGLPDGETADSPGRLVGGLFRVNYFGIQQAQSDSPGSVGGANNLGIQPAQGRGIHVLGRGVDTHYHCVLGDQISTSEVLEVLRYRILARHDIQKLFNLEEFNESQLPTSIFDGDRRGIPRYKTSASKRRKAYLSRPFG